MKIHINDHLLNGKVTCIVPKGEDVRILKRILYGVEFTNGEPEIYSITDKDLGEFYGMSFLDLDEIKERLSENLIQTEVWIKNDETEAFRIIKVFSHVEYGPDDFSVGINSSIIPYILGIRMGAEMFQGIL